MELYGLECRATGRWYIGYTKHTAEVRARQHFASASRKAWRRAQGKPTRRLTKRDRAIIKHGPDAFAVWTLAVGNKASKMKALERAYIRTFDTRRRGLNETDGGDGRGGIPLSRRHRQRIARARRKGPNRQEHNAKIATTLLGKVWTPERRQRHSAVMSAVQQGWKLGKDWRTSLSAAASAYHAWRRAGGVGDPPGRAARKARAAARRSSAPAE